MNIEEYLYNIKFQEITSKVSEKRKKNTRLAILVFAAIAVVALTGYLLMEYGII